jgi:hypothetical protein
MQEAEVKVIKLLVLKMDRGHEPMQHGQPSEVGKVNFLP